MSILCNVICNAKQNSFINQNEEIADKHIEHSTVCDENRQEERAGKFSFKIRRRWRRWSYTRIVVIILINPKMSLQFTVETDFNEISSIEKKYYFKRSALMKEEVLYHVKNHGNRIHGTVDKPSPKMRRKYLMNDIA